MGLPPKPVELVEVQSKKKKEWRTRASAIKTYEEQHKNTLSDKCIGLKIKKPYMANIGD